jgi:hypothetical protein
MIAILVIVALWFFLDLRYAIIIGAGLIFGFWASVAGLLGYYIFFGGCAKGCEKFDGN